MPYHVYLPPLTLTPLPSLDSFKDVALHPIRPALLPPVPGPDKQQLHSALLHPTSSPPVAPPPPSAPARSPTPPTASNRRRSKRLRNSTAARDAELSESYSHLSSLGSLSFSGSRPSQSCANIPTWAIPLPKLVPLHELLARRRTRERPRVSVLCGVMAVDAPVCRQRRKAGPGGRTGDLWIASWDVLAPVPGAEPSACKVKLWDECAREWGGSVRKGDVILLEDTEFIAETVGAQREGPQLVLSPRNNRLPPKPVILYRTLPRYAATRADYVYRGGPRGAVPSGERGEISAEDRALRPDLRLARSDRGVQAVAELARWCADWVGGEGP